jgi:hypothetical protein
MLDVHHANRIAFTTTSPKIHWARRGPKYPSRRSYFWIAETTPSRFGWAGLAPIAAILVGQTVDSTLIREAMPKPAIDLTWLFWTKRWERMSLERSLGHAEE